jgi:hypothetical protein
MPEIRQVRMAAFHVMRERGVAGATIAAIRARLIEVGARAGSNRDLTEIVRAWKAEQELATKVPPQIIRLAEDAARTIWEMMIAELELQSAGAALRSRRPRQRTVTSRVRPVAHKRGGTRKA